MQPDAFRRFSEAVKGPDSSVDLFGAALIIAGLRGEPVDAHACAREIDLLAESVLEQAGPAHDDESLAHAVDHELFAVAGFHGNSGDYNDPQNSYFDRVLAMRTGIPITLSLVYMEVAQRVGLRCDGIGYPGHFIVRCGSLEAAIYIDPFHQGARVDREELLAGLRGQDLAGAVAESFLAAATRRQILQRMLHNLYGIFAANGDAPRLREVVELLLCIEPWNAALVGERGMLNYHLGDQGAALHDLERYVESRPTEPVPVVAMKALAELRSRLVGGED